MLTHSERSYLNNAANIVFTVPRLDRSTSISRPSASIAYWKPFEINRVRNCNFGLIGFNNGQTTIYNLINTLTKKQEN